MSRWQTTSTLGAKVPPADVWAVAYADAEAWPQWNAEIKHAHLEEPLSLGAEAKIVFGTGLRLRFRVVEFEDGRLFTPDPALAPDHGPGSGASPARCPARGGRAGSS